LLRVFVPPSPMVPAPGGSALVAIGTRPAEEADPSALRGSRVRPLDGSAKSLVAEGIRRSYTVATLIDVVEHSDVIVYVQVAAPPQGWSTSQTRLIGSGPGRWRYASVLIDVRLRSVERLEMLGHELQHVAEIAEARDVTDAGGLERLYERIGYSNVKAHAFETRRAILVQLQVGQEVLASLDSIDTPPGARPSAGVPAAESRQLYDAYCAVCHGRNGRGRGPARELLSTTAPDLTLLAQRNGGAFPRSSVEGCIRASARRLSVAAESDMPVWTAPPSPDHDPGAAAHAESIADFLESLQRRLQ
jgi:mono/diheme cytochrome c family protein